jgi:hypothetical protein
MAFIRETLIDVSRMSFVLNEMHKLVLNKCKTKDLTGVIHSMIYGFGLSVCFLLDLQKTSKW